MLRIHTYVKALFSKPGVRKNFRVVFPNGERADIINDNIVQQSVVLTESCCSETVFRFGCCERSMIEFETVGVENIRGCRIQCFLEIDTSSLSAAQLSTVQTSVNNNHEDGILVPASSSDLGYGYYRMPYGMYIVDSCPRDKGLRAKRKVTAYTVDTTKVADVELIRMASFVPGYSTINIEAEDLAAVNLGYVLPGLASAWNYSNGSKYSWTAIQNAGAADSQTFSVTEGGHTYSVTISGTYAVLDSSGSAANAKAVLRNIAMSGWDSDEAWTWFQGVFANAGVSEPTVAAHTRLPRTYLQPHLGYDQLDQWGPYDHAPIYWLPDEGCPFYIHYYRSPQYSANTFVRLMWDLTCTFSVDGVVQETKTFFPVADLTARMGQYSGGPGANDVIYFGYTDTYTSQGTLNYNVVQYSFADSYSPLEILQGSLELRAQELGFGREGIPYMRRLNNTSPTAISLDNIESLYFEDSAVMPVGMVNWSGFMTVEKAGTIEVAGGGKSLYNMLNNSILLNEYNVNEPETMVKNRFIPHLSKAEFSPYEAVIHDMPWMMPGDPVQLATGDPDEPTLTSFILTQTIRGVQTFSQEISANGGSVIYSDNAYYEGVAMIYGDASGSGGSSSSGGGGGGGGAGIPAGGTTGQVLAKASDDDYDAGWVNPGTDWTYLGSSSNSSTPVTYPSTAKEILAVGKITHNGGATEYSAVFKVSAISDRDRLQVGGYYYGSSDYGIASVNHDAANRTLALRNIRYVSTTTGTFYFYYR